MRTCCCDYEPMSLRCQVCLGTHSAIECLYYPKRDASDLSWVKELRVVDTSEVTVINAMLDNPGWRLLHIGEDETGKTILIWGWPAE